MARQAGERARLPAALPRRGRDGTVVQNFWSTGDPCDPRSGSPAGREACRRAPTFSPSCHRLRPIVIGQGLRVRLLGTQAIKALKEDGFRVILVNSQPGHDHDGPAVQRPTYVSRWTSRPSKKILRAERPGRQSCRRWAADRPQSGRRGSSRTASWRNWAYASSAPATRPSGGPNAAGVQGRRARCGLDLPSSGVARSLAEALRSRGGWGCRASSGRLHAGRVRRFAGRGARTPSSTRSRSAWRRARSRGPDRGVPAPLEGVRAGGHAGSAAQLRRVCSIENLDPMGVHTGDSITVAPPRPDGPRVPAHAQRGLRGHPGDRRRDGGIEPSSSPVEPRTGRMVVIEMNPACRADSRWPPRRRGSPSPRSPRSSPSGTPSTRSPTTSPERRRPVEPQASAP